MNVLVGYATAHGSTRAIAERIGARLAAAGLEAEVRPLDAVDDEDAYAAFVIGSAVHGQRWLAAGKDFTARLAPVIAGRPVWLFSVGMPGALRGPFKRWAAKEKPVIEADLALAFPVRGHRLMTGVIRREHIPWPGRIAFRLMGCRYGDHRDWPAIEAWADGIARELTRVA